MARKRGKNRGQGFQLKVLLIALWWAGGFNGYGVVDASSPANTNAPPDGSPWANVGTVNDASGIYLGAGWVLTPAHVGPGNLTLDSGTFFFDGTSLRLTNSDGTPTDMVMFHLSALPSLPKLVLTSNAPTASQVDMIAYGKIAGSTQTNIGLYSGFYWSVYGYKSWGNNKVNGGLTMFDDGYGRVTLFSTDFVMPGQLTTSDPAQAAAGDSGGGVFQKISSGWQLAGMIVLTSDFSGQTPETAVYGDKTFAIDIATYRSQILAVIAATKPTISITRSGSNIQVCWPDTGVTYNLQTSPTLSPTSWTAATGILSSAPGQFCVLLPVTNGASFRLKKQ